MVTKKILIYGSYGYTGNLIVELAVSRGHQPVLGGRNLKKLEEQAQKHNLEFTAFDLSEKEKLDKALREVELVLHCAGPYAHTTKLMLEACMETQTHYLDITGEIEVFEWIALQDGFLKEAGVVAIPGTGFDVVPSDCLASYLKSQLPDATNLELAFKGVGELSRGTALTMVENIDRGGMIRKDGKMKSVKAAYQTREIKFGERNSLAVSIPWGDVSTAYYSTGIPNIIVFTAVDSASLRFIQSTNYIGWLLSMNPIQGLLKSQIKQRINGPNATTRENAKSYLWGKVTNDKGETVEATLVTPEAYWLTAQTAFRAAEKLLKSDLKGGFYTPSMAFGADFILEFEGVKRGLIK